MSYTVKIVDNDNGNVLLDSNKIEVLLGSFVERVDNLRCSCSMFAHICASLPAIAASYDALEELRKDIAERYPKVKNSKDILDGIAFDSSEELDVAVADLIRDL